MVIIPQPKENCKNERKETTDEEGGYYEAEIIVKKRVLVEADSVDDALKKVREKKYLTSKSEIISTGSIIQKFAKGTKKKKFPDDDKS